MSVWNNFYKSEKQINQLIEERNIPRPIALSLIGRGITLDKIDSFLKCS